MNPRHGVVTLFGYDLQIRVDRGHLLLEDGIGDKRRRLRLPRVAHGLRRLVVIGADGFVSLAALRWLADQDAAFVMLERDGSVLATTGPVRPSDARLRRAQALAEHSGTALRIVRELISQKLAGQEKVARDKLHNSEAAQMISQFRATVASAETIQTIRLLEAQAGLAYWSCWHDVAINFPRKDLQRVPEHWRTFGFRKSPLSGSPRLAANPPNAMLNYLYAVLESEARLAVAALGLDPGLGVLHVDTPSRDSLACDLMETVRPQVDAYILDWIMREPLKREWFFEQRNGNCRLMGSFAVQLSETAPMWGRAVAPFAEWIARTLWSTIQKPIRQSAPATRLTQNRKREAKGAQALPPVGLAPHRENICRNCGAAIGRRATLCSTCAAPLAVQTLLGVATKGREASHSADAEARRAEAQRRHRVEQESWKSSDLPTWLDKEAYTKKVLPLLRSTTNAAIAIALGVSLPYAIDIRRGKRIPHPRHWQALAKLVGVSQSCGQTAKHNVIRLGDARA